MFTTLLENCSQFSLSLCLSSFTLLPFSLPFRDVYDVWDGMIFSLHNISIYSKNKRDVAKIRLPNKEEKMDGWWPNF